VRRGDPLGRICGSDLHLIDTGFALGKTLGHELAGVTPGRHGSGDPSRSCRAEAARTARAARTTSAIATRKS